MKYLNFILTALAIVLILHLFRPGNSNAGDVRDVNIQSVGGYIVTGGAIKTK